MTWARRVFYVAGEWRVHGQADGPTCVGRCDSVVLPSGRLVMTRSPARVPPRAMVSRTPGQSDFPAQAARGRTRTRQRIRRRSGWCVVPTSRSPRSDRTGSENSFGVTILDYYRFDGVYPLVRKLPGPGKPAPWGDHCRWDVAVLDSPGSVSLWDRARFACVRGRTRSYPPRVLGTPEQSAEVFGGEWYRTKRPRDHRTRTGTSGSRAEPRRHQDSGLPEWARFRDRERLFGNIPLSLSRRVGRKPDPSEKAIKAWLRARARTVISRENIARQIRDYVMLHQFTIRLSPAHRVHLRNCRVRDR